MNIPDLDPRAVQGIMKMGGKKKLDALFEMIKASGPERAKELKEASSVSEAHAAAQALKGSASHLGLSALEDLCDQILSERSWSPGHPLAAQVAQALSRGLKSLAEERAKL